MVSVIYLIHGQCNITMIWLNGLCLIKFGSFLCPLNINYLSQFLIIVKYMLTILVSFAYVHHSF